MVLTLPECRGRGFARRLMREALAYVEAKGVGWTKLDATDMGHHLYESLGYRDEQPVERWKREPGGGPFEESELAFVADPELDRKASGPLARGRRYPDRSSCRRRFGAGRRPESTSLTFAASQGSTTPQSQNVGVTLSTGASGTWIAYFPDGLRRVG